MKTAKVNTQLIDIEQIWETPTNPNVEDAKTFAALVEEIDQDGFEEPLIVVPRTNMEPGSPGYTVVSGNHRLKALKLLGYKEVDCVVHDWDADTAKIKVVKRNKMKGETDPEKFTALVDSIKGFTHDQLVDAMCLKSMDEFADLYQPADLTAQDGAFLPRHHEDLVSSLTLILNQIFEEYGHTIPFSLLFFIAAGFPHLTIMANARTKAILNDLVREAVVRKIDINAALSVVLDSGLQAVDWENLEKFNNAVKLEGDETFKPIPKEQQTDQSVLWDQLEDAQEEQ